MNRTSGGKSTVTTRPQLRAAIYARYSSDRQFEASIDDQLRLCRRLAEREGIYVSEVFSDAAISGASGQRPGYQSLIKAAQNRDFDIIIAESLDRLSRDLEETARLFKMLRFAGITLLTVSEGEIGELHIGLRGTMGALYLKDLAEKTHRGLEGRVRQGHSGGGKAFGYKVVDGAVGHDTGLREIIPAEADIVRDIFWRFANGESPRAIAKYLNANGIVGVNGRQWMDTTIRGHRKRGIGILNNELYIGKLVWNRQRFIKDPISGKRVARMNQPEDMIITEVPDLRIIDDNLWQSVKTRQDVIDQSRTDPYVTNPLNNERRPQFVFSGLLTCGVCGGGYTIRGKDRYGCANRANRGTCSNRRTILRPVLEDRVLASIKEKLVTPELVAEFISTYAQEWNRLQQGRRTEETNRKRRLAAVEGKLAAIMEAIERGIVTESTKDRLLELEKEKRALKAIRPEPAMPTIHPNITDLYRRRVERLETLLGDPDTATEAMGAIRSMIDKIVIMPGESRGEVRMEVFGELAVLLGLNDGAQGVRLSVVAGAGFEPAAFRL